eukprot:TRINITY_DN3425_c0_g1_i2.p1 TRINITY_DN3425_c0_g1~~TRINITY_DN3425_c0_g1_i2.p1  ORF type:complete len:382 (-),score=89.14 TRINITY_DN3425_c0_g1_i2:28-1173(-)
MLARLELSRPMIVCDPYFSVPVAKEVNLAVLTSLLNGKFAYSVFSGVAPDPTTGSVAACAHAIRGMRGCDCVVAFGGGSTIDTAKAANLLLAGKGKPLRDFKVPAVADKAAFPLICIPTTAGSGADSSKYTVVMDTETNEQMLIGGLGALAVAAIVDFRLTLSVPSDVVAATGMDALAHAIEAFVSRQANPCSDTFALSAMRRVAKNVEIACGAKTCRDHATFLRAREQMSLGATEAGVAFSNSSVCLAHALAGPLGGLFRVPHGMAVCMVTPVATLYTLREGDGKQRYAECARAMDLLGLGGVSRTVLEEALLVVQLFRRLNKALQIPSPKQFGIPQEEYNTALGKMAYHAELSGSAANNPRVPTREEMVALYRKIYSKI